MAEQRSCSNCCSSKEKTTFNRYALVPDEEVPSVPEVIMICMTCEMAYRLEEYEALK